MPPSAPTPPSPLAPWRIWTARILALAADAAQWGFIPLFAPGLASPAEDVLDVTLAIAMTLLVGWHWSYVPAFLLELVPGADLVPTWTASVLLATRPGRKRLA